jgi:hypothetical protein
MDKKTQGSCEEKIRNGFSKDDLEKWKLQYDELNTLFKYLFQKTLKSETISEEARLERIVDSLEYESKNNKTNAGFVMYLKSFEDGLPITLRLMYLISAAQTEQNSKKKVQPTLRKEFNKFLVHLSKTSVYDVKTKVFDLSDAKNTTPLQSLQYALLIFRERLDKRLELKTPNTSIYKLFNAHFENHKNMTSQNWNNFKETNFDLRNENDFYISLKKELEKVSL